METEYLGNAYTTQSSNDGCVAVACPIDKEKSNHYNFYTRQKYSGFSRCDNQFG